MRNEEVKTIINKKEELIGEIINHNLLFVAPSMDKEKWVLLKNGIRGPIFFDTSKIISYPDLAQNITQFAISIIRNKEIDYDLIMGAPYGGLSLSYFLSYALKSPCLTLRKEGVKKDGTMPTAAEILGIYKKGNKVLIIEDAIVSANTVLEFISRLKKVGLEVFDILTIIDVGRGGAENLKKQNILLHSMFTWAELYDYYKNNYPSRLNPEVKNYLDGIFKSNI